MPLRYKVFYVVLTKPHLLPKINATKKRGKRKHKYSRRNNGGGLAIEKNFDISSVPSTVVTIDCTHPLKIRDFTFLLQNMRTFEINRADITKRDLMNLFVLDKNNYSLNNAGGDNLVHLSNACDKLPVAIRISKTYIERPYDTETNPKGKYLKMDEYLKDCKTMIELSDKNITPYVYWFGTITTMLDSYGPKTHFCTIMEKGNDMNDQFADFAIRNERKLVQLVKKIYEILDIFTRKYGFVNYDIKLGNMIVRKKNNIINPLLIDLDFANMIHIDDLFTGIMHLPTKKEKIKAACLINRFLFLMHCYANHNPIPQDILTGRFNPYFEKEIMTVLTTPIGSTIIAQFIFFLIDPKSPKYDIKNGFALYYYHYFYLTVILDKEKGKRQRAFIEHMLTYAGAEDIFARTRSQTSASAESKAAAEIAQIENEFEVYDEDNSKKTNSPETAYCSFCR